MKIGILLSHFMNRYIDYFIELCNKNNIQVDIFQYEDYELEQPVNKTYTIKAKWKAKKFKTNKAVEDEIKSLVNIDDYDFFISDVIGLSFKNACNLFHTHTTKYRIERTYSKLLQPIIELCHYKCLQDEKNYYKNTRLTIIGAKEIQKDYAENDNIPIERIKIIYPGMNEQTVGDVTLKKKQEKPFTIGGCTAGFVTKGGYNILGALKILKKDFTPKELKFKIVNPNYQKQKQLKLYIKLFGLDKYIEFLPLYDDVIEFYEKIDCFICASLHEPFGRVVPECMNLGIPVICGSNVGAADIIKDGINGYIYTADKNIYQNIADTIKKVMKNKDNNSELIKQAKETVKDITWENFAKQIFEEILKASKAN